MICTTALNKTLLYILYFPDFSIFPDFIDNLLSKIDNFSIFLFCPDKWCFPYLILKTDGKGESFRGFEDIWAVLGDIWAVLGNVFVWKRKRGGYVLSVFKHLRFIDTERKWSQQIKATLNKCVLYVLQAITESFSSLLNDNKKKRKFLVSKYSKYQTFYGFLDH